MSFRRSIFYVLCVAGSLPLLGQEQTVLVGSPRAVLLQPELQIAAADANIVSPANARALIERTLGAASLGKDSTVMIHVLRWKDDGTLDKHKWFLYRDGTNSQEEFTGLRIYGHHKVSLLYVHLNAKAATATEARRYTAVNQMFNSLFARFGMNEAGTRDRIELLNCIAADPAFVNRGPADVAMGCPKVKPEMPPAQTVTDSELEDLLNNLKNQFAGTHSEMIAGRLAIMPTYSAGKECTAGTGLSVDIGGGPAVSFGDYCVAPNFLKVGYRVVAKAKLPSALSNLLELIQPQSGFRVDALQVQSVALWGGEQMNITSVPSDVKVTPIANDKELDSRTFDNEGLYFWDISVGLPIKSIKDTTYDSTAQGFSAKKVSRQNLYAMFNVFPIKVDTKASGNWRLTPALLVGVGIVNRPLDRLMFGGGLGIGKVQFFVGTAMTRKQFPQSNGTLSDPVYRTNLVYGLNVPIRQVITALKTAK